jgi:indolepyruvate ferredoxin oxidoreductase
MLAGLEVRGLDQTGLSQKAGPVSSDVRISRGEAAASNLATAGGVDCWLAFDLLAAASDSHREGAEPGRTVVIGSVEEVPTGRMVTNPGSTSFPALESLQRRLDAASRPELNRYLDAAALCRGLFGNTTSANVLTLGVAVQIGALPLDPASIERAIELNGVAVSQNVAAFRFGRLWAIDPQRVDTTAGVTRSTPESLDELIGRLAVDLADYQDRAYARRFRERVDAARAAERRIDPESTAFTEAVARHLHKLMAYKDEYEVARLALLPESQARYRTVGGADTKVTYHLHPPLLRALGVDRKLKFRRTGPPSFKALRAMKKLRGTVADPFGRDEVRKLERAMIPEYEQAVDTLIGSLTAANLGEATEIASLPDQVRGYEHLKLERAAAYRAELAKQIEAWT